MKNNNYRIIGGLLAVQDLGQDVIGNIVWIFLFFILKHFLFLKT